MADCSTAEKQQKCLALQIGGLKSTMGYLTAKEGTNGVTSEETNYLWISAHISLLSLLFVMAKRKQLHEEQAISELADADDLEMLTDDEAGDEASSDDGEVDDFPELNGDDPDTSDDDIDDEDIEGLSQEENENVSDSDSDSSIAHSIFPRPKTITSQITGEPKRVYPEIEPDYDSDSSTEEVRAFSSLLYASVQILIQY